MGVPKQSFVWFLYRLCSFLQNYEMITQVTATFIFCAEHIHVCVVWTKDFSIWHLDDCPLNPGWTLCVALSICCGSDKFSQHWILDREHLLSDLSQMQLILVRNNLICSELVERRNAPKVVISLWRKEVKRRPSLTAFLISVVVFLRT